MSLGERGQVQVLWVEGAERLGRLHLIFPAFMIRKETKLSAGERGWEKLDGRLEDSVKHWDKW